MEATALLHELGQSIRLDNITRDLFDRAPIEGYVGELPVLTSNPTIFDHAIRTSTAHDRESCSGVGRLKMNVLG
jgi:transaldolase